MQVDFAAWPGDMHSACLSAAAALRGVPQQRVMAALRPGARPRAWLRLQAGGWVWLYRNGLLYRGPTLAEAASTERHGLSHVNGTVAAITQHKQATKDHLAALGVSVPQGALFTADQAAAAAALFASLARPACIKPNGGKRGRDAAIGILGPTAFVQAFAAVTTAHDAVVVEEQVVGEAVRLFYVRPHVVGVRVDRPASVVGDGRSAIAALVDAKNAERRQRALPGHVAIELDDAALRYLADRDLSAATVPAAGQRVFLRGTSNIPTGGDALDCRARLHSSYVALVEGFCNAIPGLCVAAVDTVIATPEAPAAVGNHWVLEINSAPGVVPFHFPWRGEPQDVSGALIDRLCAGGW